MFRILYAFTSSDTGTLKANEGDLFCGMCKDGSGLWTQVANGKGTIGYLPSNYLELCTWADKKFVLKFIDEGIEEARRQGPSSALHAESLRLLVAHRAFILNSYSQFISKFGTAVVHTPNTPSSSGTAVVHTPNTPSSSGTAVVHTPGAPKHVHESTSTSELSNQKASGDSALKETDINKLTNNPRQRESPLAEVMAAKLTEVLRFHTDLSHEKCKLGVMAVLNCLHLHNVSPEQLVPICHAVEQDNQLEVVDSIEQSHDVVEMRSIFDTIAECKDDSQQRGWHLHDDEQFIHKQLCRLLDVLTSGNRDVLVADIKKDLDCVLNLVLYYQIETRSTLRATMLQIFAALCAMSGTFITTLLCSVLTLELVRDFMSTSDEQRLIYSAIVLSMLFSTGEQIPVHHNELLGGEFVNFLLDKIETSENMRIVDVCLELLLSFNQHFNDSTANSVLSQLAKRQEAAILTQTFLKLFNEGEDPVRVIPNDDQMSSVVKFAIDLYSVDATANLLYTNDIKVLIDIIIRQLTDLSEHDSVRTDYLSLIQLILANSDYDDHQHRKEDLVSALNQIEFNEEATTSQSEMDVRIVKEIRKLLGSLQH